VPITYDGPMVSRMDIVRLAGAKPTPDVRFMPSFHGWKARFIVVFPDQMRVQTVLDLVERGGKVGVGEWRQERGGDFGTFRLSRVVESKAERQEVRKACRALIPGLIIPPWAMNAQLDPELLRKIADSQTGTGDSEEQAPPPAEDDGDKEDAKPARRGGH